MVKRQATGKPKGRAKTDARAPTGPHSPISNLVTKTAKVRSDLVSSAEVGSAPGSVDPGKMAKRASALESAAAAPPPQAPKTNKLQDIGRASFRDPGAALE